MGNGGIRMKQKVHVTVEITKEVYESLSYWADECGVTVKKICEKLIMLGVIGLNGGGHIGK